MGTRSCGGSLISVAATENVKAEKKAENIFTAEKRNNKSGQFDKMHPLGVYYMQGDRYDDL